MEITMAAALPFAGNNNYFYLVKNKLHFVSSVTIPVTSPIKKSYLFQRPHAKRPSQFQAA